FWPNSAVFGFFLGDNGLGGGSRSRPQARRAEGEDWSRDREVGRPAGLGRGWESGGPWRGLGGAGERERSGARGEGGGRRRGGVWAPSEARRGHGWRGQASRLAARTGGRNGGTVVTGGNR